MTPTQIVLFYRRFGEVTEVAAIRSGCWAKGEVYKPAFKAGEVYHPGFKEGQKVC